MYAIKYLTI